MLLFIAMCFLIVSPAFAREDPPKGGLFQWLFGGTIHFKRAGHTWGISVKKENGRIIIYNPNKPFTLNPAEILIIDFNVEGGRKKDDHLHNIVRISDKSAGKMTKILDFDGQYGRLEYRIPRYNAGYIFIRLYTSINGKDQDQYSGMVFWIDPNGLLHIQPNFENNRQNDSSQVPMQVTQGPTSTIHISFYEDHACKKTCRNFVVPEITIFSNGKQVIKKRNVMSSWPIEGVPCGKITIDIEPCNWYIEPHGNWKKDRQRNVYYWDLKQGEKLIIKLFKKGGR